MDVLPDDTLFTSPQMGAVQLDAVVSNDSGNATLKWCSVPCNVDESASSITVEPDTGWRYISVMTTEGQCQSSDLYIILPESPSAVETPVRDGNFSIYPNPASDEVIISFSNVLVDQPRIQVWDGYGKLLTQLKVGNNQRIDLSSLASGYYMIQLLDDQELIAVRRVFINQ